LDNWRSHKKAVRVALVLVALTVGVSLLYAVQYYVGGPLRLTVASEVYDLALSPDKSLVAAAANDGLVRLWRIEDNWALRKLSGHDGAVTSLAFAPDGVPLFTAGHDGKIRLWDIASEQILATLEAPDGKSLAGLDLSADGLTLAAIDNEGVVHVWTSTSGSEGDWQLVNSIASEENDDRALALSPDGLQVATGYGESVQIWDARSGQPTQKLQGYWEDKEAQEDWLGHKGPVMALAFSPDGELLASGSADKTIAFWELESGEVAWTGEGHFAAVTQLVFAPEGDVALSSSQDAKAKAWRIPGGKSTGSFVGHLSAVNAVAPGPEPNTLISAGEDGTVRMWNMVNTTEIRVEWTREGIQPMWGRLFSLWMLISGLVGLICLWGMARFKCWTHLLALTLYTIGPIIVFGMSLFELFSLKFTWGTRLQIGWPLIGAAVWYAALVILLMREPVAVHYQASASLPLAEQLMTSLRTRRLRSAILVGAAWVLLLVLLYSALRRFNLDVAFMGHFFSFIMAGAGQTMLVSAASIALAVILALIGALGRLSKNPLANGISGFYVSLIRGTPLLVQIYIWYLGLPRLNVILSALPAGILALGVNYGAYMTETFRAGIQAINKGQYEAAEALGMSRAQTFRRIVLPQAFRIVIPPIGNDFIAMMKDSSLVSVMGVWELTFRSAKIGRQYFRSMETFIVAAAFYWILTMIFQFLQGKLETHMARGERK